MPGDAFAANVTVKVDGQTVADRVYAALAGLRVDTFANAPDHLVLRFSDEHATVLDGTTFRVGRRVEAGVTPSDGTPVTLFDGEITALESEQDPLGRTTTVRALADAHRMFHGRRTRSWVKQRTDEVVKAVAGEHRLSVEVAASTTMHEWVSQVDESDWDFVRRLADGEGWTVAAHGRRLVVGPPARAATGSRGKDARRDPLVIERGVNVVSYRAALTAADQVPSVTVKGWDPKSREVVVGTAKEPPERVDAGGVDVEKLAKDLGVAPYVVGRADIADQSAAAVHARALRQRLGSGAAELDVEILGTPEVSAGTVVALSGFGAVFDGRYTVTAARHQLDGERGYITSVTVAGASDRSVHGLAAAAGRGVGRGRLGDRGLLPAVVTNVKDPGGLGRVKLKLPYLADDVETGWARVVHPGAGKSRGLVLMPEVNDEVLVGFAEGDLDHPYVLGGLFNGKDTPEDAWGKVHGDGAVERRVLTSRTGLRLEITESSAGEKVEITTKDRKNRVSVVQKPDAAIEVVSAGPVTVKAQQEVTVEAVKDVAVTSTSGNVTVTGTAVTIEGKQSVEVKAPQVKVNGQAAVAIKAVDVKIDGDASTQLASSGVTTVRGSLVKIN